jgi:hypothetical protein
VIEGSVLLSNTELEEMMIASPKMKQDKAPGVFFLHALLHAQHHVMDIL